MKQEWVLVLNQKFPGSWHPTSRFLSYFSVVCHPLYSLTAYTLRAVAQAGAQKIRAKAETWPKEFSSVIVANSFLHGRISNPRLRKKNKEKETVIKHDTVMWGPYFCKAHLLFSPYSRARRCHAGSTPQLLVTSSEPSLAAQLVLCFSFLMSQLQWQSYNAFLKCNFFFYYKLTKKFSWSV